MGFCSGFWEGESNLSSRLEVCRREGDLLPRYTVHSNYEVLAMHGRQKAVDRDRRWAAFV